MKKKKKSCVAEEEILCGGAWCSLVVDKNLVEIFEGCFSFPLIFPVCVLFYFFGIKN